MAAVGWRREVIKELAGALGDGDVELIDVELILVELSYDVGVRGDVERNDRRIVRTSDERTDGNQRHGEASERHACTLLYQYANSQ